METLYEIFSFLPVKKLLDCNWTSLRLFRVSQISYRPLRQSFKERVIQKLHIQLEENLEIIISVNFVFRLTDSEEREAKTVERKLDRKVNRSLPTVCLPSYIVAIERVCLQFWPGYIHWRKVVLQIFSYYYIAGAGGFYFKNKT